MDDKKNIKRKRANKRKLSGVFFVDLRVVFKRAYFRFSKSKPVKVAVISSIAIIIGSFFRYMWIKNRTVPSLNDPRQYVQWPYYEKALKRIEDLEYEKEEAKNVIDSLNKILKELDDNWLIYILPSENDKKSIEINKHIQRILRACREFNRPIDGNPYETYKAMIDFQKKYKLEKKDAIIGRETWTAIIDKLEEVKGEPGSLISYAYPH